MTYYCAEKKRKKNSLGNPERLVFTAPPSDESGGLTEKITIYAHSWSGAGIGEKEKGQKAREASQSGPTRKK